MISNVQNRHLMLNKMVRLPGRRSDFIVTVTNWIQIVIKK